MNSPATEQKHELRTFEDLERLTLSNASGLTVDLYPNGTVCAFRHGDVLINQTIGVPPEGAPFRLWLRDRSGGVSLITPASADTFQKVDEHTAAWHGVWNEWGWVVQLVLDEKSSAWSWQVTVDNRAVTARTCNAVICQDLGLGLAGAVRSNESYASHYIDHSVHEHAAWGPVLFSRQNLSQQGKHPWLAAACTTGADAFATDAVDVFGFRQRSAGVAAILENDSLPSVRRQGESACAALQSRSLTVEPGASEHASFSFTYVDNHPEVSGQQDVSRITASRRKGAAPLDSNTRPVASVFDAPTLLHGESLGDADWDRLYPDRHHEEIEAGSLWSFFTDDGRHVVSAAKESAVERSHGHVLHGSSEFMHNEHAIGSTVYASGIFSAQIFCGNPNIMRLLSVVRDPLQRTRGCGQRVWVYLNDAWMLLGTPSAFELGLHHAAWLYQVEGRLLEITTRVHPDANAVTLRCRVREGQSVAWKVTHQVALGTNELDQHGTIEVDPEQGEMTFYFDEASEAANRSPGIGFLLSANPQHEVRGMGADEAIWDDGQARGAPYAVVESSASADFSISIRVTDSSGKAHGSREGFLPELNWRIQSDKTAARELSDILPWFRHDAWIHLCAPHGLEQYGGAAWGVRDVCQGPVEWLITEQRYADIKQILVEVFAQQYEGSSLWPQWFMLGQYSDIQQKHCHGDIMFWPLKALCDYAAAANDPAILDVEVPFTDDNSFGKTSHALPLSEHVKCVLQKYRELCIPGTALVAYGDGDWDDTLQPARPEMREGMVSTWTVELAYQVFSQLVELYRRSGRDDEAADVASLVEQIRADFLKHLMPDGIVAGFAVFKNGKAEPMLHPRDDSSGMHYRLLPMIRGVISGLFDREQSQKHLEIIREHLRGVDGVRLMDRPVAYTGGVSHRFQRAETAAYFGREVALQYVHAHIRYTEAIARLGDADETWWGLRIINPLGLRKDLPVAAPRQSNVYYSSSDADFTDRYQAAEQYGQLMDGKVPVKSGWRLYSSGPGLYLHKVRSSLFGIREHYDNIFFDPVLPADILPCALEMQHEGKQVTVQYVAGDAPGITVNGKVVQAQGREENPYRDGGLSIDREDYGALLDREKNTVIVTVVSN